MNRDQLNNFWNKLNISYRRKINKYSWANKKNQKKKCRG